MEKAIAALATPQGVGGIAVVRISGEDATQVAARVFHPVSKTRTLQNAKGYTALFGHFVWQGEVLDEVVALVFRAPHSYTGEDVVELSCHGGHVVSDRLLRALYESGAAVAEAGEFTKRAFLNGRISLTQAEAVMNLIGAHGADSARAAVAAMEGALYRRIKEIRGSLLELLGHIAAYTDYPEEGVPELETDSLVEQLNESIGALQTLVENYDKGALVRNGVPTAIIGSPNVGKSTLLNLLSGFERAIVTPVAGTTRDVVQQEVELGGIQLLLADTAGLHETEDVVEAEGIRRSRAEMEKAALVLAVFDAAGEVSDADIALAKECAGRRALAILNKTDVGHRFDETLIAPYFSKVVAGSALQDDGFQTKVADAVKEILGVANFDPATAMLANERHLQAAQEALAALCEARKAAETLTLDAVGVCVEDAHAALVRLTGEDATEDVINEVFSKFCVGK